MATIQLMRPDEKVNQKGQMSVYLDGQLLGLLSNNETKSFAVPAGRHTLKAKIDTQGSKAFTFILTDNETKALVIATDNEANSPGVSATGDFFDLIINGAIMLYYFTIGHNRYLTISELKMQ